MSMVTWPWQIRREVKQKDARADRRLEESQRRENATHHFVEKLAQRREINNIAEGLEELYRRQEHDQDN